MNGPVHGEFFGGSGTDTLRGGISVTGGGCVVDAVQIELLDGDGNILGVSRLGNPPFVVEYFLFFSWSAAITSDGRRTPDETSDRIVAA